MKVGRVKILNHTWKLVWAKRGQAFPGLLSKTGEGVCESPELTHKKIILRKGLRRRKMVEAILHELLHAADWTKDEEWIHNTAYDMARELWRLLMDNYATKERCITCDQHCLHCRPKD